MINKIIKSDKFNDVSLELECYNLKDGLRGVHSSPLIKLNKGLQELSKIILDIGTSKPVIFQVINPIDFDMQTIREKIRIEASKLYELDSLLAKAEKIINDEFYKES